MEHTVWNTSPPEELLCQIDMTACFMAFPHSTSEANVYFQRYGIVTQDMCHEIAINGPLTADSPELHLTGIADVTEWQFFGNLSPYITDLFARHFNESGWTVTAMLAFALENKILKSVTVRTIIYSV